MNLVTENHSFFTVLTHFLEFTIFLDFVFALLWLLLFAILFFCSSNSLLLITLLCYRWLPIYIALPLRPFVAPIFQVHALVIVCCSVLSTHSVTHANCL